MAKKRKILKVKPTTLTVLLIIAVAWLLFNVITYFKIWDMSMWIPTLGNIAIIGILISESFYMAYLKSSTYKRLKFWDVINLFTLLVAGMLLMVTIVSFAQLDGALWGWFTNMAGSISIIAMILALLHIFWK